MHKMNNNMQKMNCLNCGQQMAYAFEQSNSVDQLIYAMCPNGHFIEYLPLHKNMHLCNLEKDFIPLHSTAKFFFAKLKTLGISRAQYRKTSKKLERSRKWKKGPRI